jgi:cytochrome b561
LKSCWLKPEARPSFSHLTSAIAFMTFTSIATTRARYTRPAIAFHWLLALLITGSFAFGLYMVELPFSPARLKQYNWHKWAGITILSLSALRLLWRLSHRPPALDSGTPAWQANTSRGAHAVLYALFFAAPLAGWAYSSAAGFPVVYFGLFPLPDLVARSPELAATLKLTHRVLTYSLAALVGLHVAAALKHQWLDRDRLLSRMNPF